MYKGTKLNINIKYFLYLYMHKNLAPRTISKSVSVIYENIYEHDVYTKFIFFVFFNDICPEIKSPEIFVVLHTSIIEYIRTNLFDYKKNKPPVVSSNELPTFMLKDLSLNSSIKMCLTDSKIEVLEMLLVFEKSLEFFYLSDFKYIVDVIKGTKYKNLIRIVNNTNKISPIFSVILEFIKIEDVPEHHADFTHFLKALKLDYSTGFKYINGNCMNPKRLERTILYSKFSVINEYHKYFINFFPELIYGNFLSKERMVYFEHPLGLPLNHKILKTYIPSILYYIKVKHKHITDNNIDLLYRTIFIERILKSEPFKIHFKKVIHPFIISSPQILQILLTRQFDLRNIDFFIKYVPLFRLSFDLCLKLCMKVNNNFYVTILMKLLEKYPDKENIKKIQEKILIFPSYFVLKFKHLSKKLLVDHEETKD